MRLNLSSVLALALLTGCGAKYKPGTAVLTGWDRTRTFAVDETSKVQYTDQARVQPPVVPLMAFGAAFDLDVVVRTKNPNWDMHEFARISGPEGPIWLALDSRSGTLDQVIVADVEQIDAWMPEIPVERKASPVNVVDRSTNDEIDVTLIYENADNEEVEVSILGAPPFRWQKKRNGNTLGHSSNHAMPLLDVPHRESLFKAKVKYDGRSANVRKIMGLVPFQFAMEQVQGGLATGSYYTIPGEVRPLEAERPEPIVHGPEIEEEAPVEEVVEEVSPLVAQMESGWEDLQGCYTTSAKANPDIEGKILLSWVVTEGAATDVTVVLDTAGDEALSTCISEKIGGWMWGEEVDGEVGHPINIKKGEGVMLHPEEEEGEAEAEGDEGTDDALPEADTGDEEIAEEGDGEDALPDGDDMGGEDDLLADDEDALVDDAAQPEQTIYNGLADFTMFQRMRSGNEVETHWDVEHQGNRVVVTQVSPMRTLRYEYLVHYDSLELADVAVYQVGRSVPVMHMDINPALPDLRRPFSGRAKSTYVIDVNGQGGYATGEVEAWWSESGPKVKVMPSAPEWTTDGDLVSSIVFRDEGFDVLVQKVSD